MTVITAATPAPPRARRVASRQQWIGLLYVAPAVALVVVF
ncbi:sugar ABC transporter permease, partial [Mesorhizobium sp. M7A.F.Ca.MR.362.00.0.0]